MNRLLRVDVENSEKSVKSGNGKVRFISQAVNASDRSDAALVLPEHALGLRPEVVECKVASATSDQDLLIENTRF